MKKIIFLGIIFLCLRLNAQTLDWVKTIGYNQLVQSGYVAIEGTTSDNSGYLYSVTYGTSQIDFSFNNSNQTVPNSLVSGVIIKSNSNGTQVWQKQLIADNSGGGNCQPKKVIYKNGFIYLAGNISGTVDMNPDSGVNNLFGSSASFIAKYDTTGTFFWAKQFGGMTNSKVNDIAIDNNDAVYLTGSFSTSSFSFNNVNYNNAGGSDIFLLKYNSDGTESWCNIYGTNATCNEQGNTIALDQSNNIILGGVFGNIIDFNSGPGINTLSSNGNSDGFLVKLDQLGNYLNGIAIGGLDADLINNINLLGNDLVVTGRICAGSIDMDGGPAVQNLTGHPNGTGFLLKINLNFNYQWAKAINHPYPSGGSVGDFVKIVGNNIYMCGSFAGTADLDFNSNVDFLVTTSSQAQNTFFLKTDLNGAFIFGGALVNVGNVWEMNNYGYTNYPLGMSISTGGLYLCGGFKGPVDFDPDPAVNSNTASSNTPTGIGIVSGYLVKIINCSSSTNSLQQTGCGAYTWNGQTYSTSGTYVQNFQTVAGCDSTVTLNLTINSPTSSSFSETSCEPYTWNGNTYASSGQYSQTLTGSNGCDSIVTLNLTILNGPTAQVTQDGLLLTANTVSGATYQWIYCSDLTSVPNQTFSQFAPQANGTYAVVITDNCGADTSDCITISTIGIDELNNYFSVYPNPTSSELNVSTDTLRVNTYFEIYDLNNRLIKLGKVLDVENKIDVNSLSNGVYILKLDNTSAIRFVKQ